MARRKSPLRCRSSANSEAGPRGEGQDARSKEKATLLGACRARETAPALPQLQHPCRRPVLAKRYRHHADSPAGLSSTAHHLTRGRPRSKTNSQSNGTEVQAWPSGQADVGKQGLTLRSLAMRYQADRHVFASSAAKSR
jgi:hypothetical protein